MVVATCYIRLNKYDEALKMLQLVIDRSPTNYKALYQYSFCQRASGSQKDAIEGLTKVSICLRLYECCFVFCFPPPH
jgi:tetratricopeptide (TPR) repeat protein